MYILNIVIILIIMYSNVITAINKIHMYLLHFNKIHLEDVEWSCNGGAVIMHGGIRCVLMLE